MHINFHNVTSWLTIALVFILLTWNCRDLQPE